jgi:hypothetical protein
MPDIQPAPPKSRRKAGPASDFVVKEEHGDGSVTWVNPNTLDEIRLHESTAPTPDILKALAANGIVPKRPHVDDMPDDFDAPQAELIPEEEPEETALSRVLTRIKTIDSADVRAEVRIYRVKSDRTESYCGKFTVEQYDEHGEELIRAHFGDGSYRVRVYGPSTTPGIGNYGKFSRLTNYPLEIEPSRLPLAASIPGAAGAVADNGTNAMIAQLQSELARLRATPAVDPMQSLKQAAEVMRLFGIQPGAAMGKPQSVVQQIAEMEQMLKLRRTLREESESESDGGGDKTAGMMDIARDVLGVLKNQQPTAPEPIPALAVPQTFQPPQAMQPQYQPTPQPIEGENVNLAQNALLNVTVAALINAANRGDTVETHAPGLADKMPDEVIDMMEIPLWYDLMIANLTPANVLGVEKHRDWFLKLRDAVLANVYADESEDAPPAPPAA